MDVFNFARHGLTDANQKKLLCGGGWDIPLNDEGHAQAAQAAQTYRTALSHIRLIVCSPLLRARQTAEHFANALELPVHVWEEFKEQGLGDWEQKPWADVPEFFAGDKDPPGGESLHDFDARIERGLRRVLAEQGPALIISHGAVWYALHRILGLTAEAPGSCTVFQFQREKDHFQRSLIDQAR